MSKAVKPLNISLLIRGSRYILLFSGIIYGIIRRSGLTVYEATAGPKRHHVYEEEEKRIAMEKAKSSKAEFGRLTNELNIPEMPPGWENDIDI